MLPRYGAWRKGGKSRKRKETAGGEWGRVGGGGGKTTGRTSKPDFCGTWVKVCGIGQEKSRDRKRGRERWAAGRKERVSMTQGGGAAVGLRDPKK